MALPHILLLVIASPSFGLGQVQEEAFSVDKLAKVGARSVEKLKAGAASWTAVHTMDSGAKVSVNIVADPSRRRTTVAISSNGQDVEIARIVERNGLWYASDQSGDGKYRPFEAPLAIPSTYIFLNRSEPMFFTQPTAFHAGKFLGVSGDIASWDLPLPPVARATLERNLEQIKKLRDANPEAFKRKDFETAMKTLSDLLEHGERHEVDVRTGVVTRMGTEKMTTRIQEFKFLEKVDVGEFVVEGKSWTDFTKSPLGGDRSNLVMIGHTSLWQKGQKGGDLNAGILNVTTGEFRRIPFTGSSAIGGSFSKDRSKVYVSGLGNSGVMSLFEIDLQTGANRPIGNAILKSGFILSPVLSPDGKTIVFVHGMQGPGLLTSRIGLLDLATDETRYVGEPFDTGIMSWLPDSTGLIVVERTYEQLDSVGERWVSRVDLDGRRTRLIRGDQPVVLGDGKTILYEADGLWNLCGLDGKNGRLLGDGLRSLGFPAPAPDGKRLLMMRFSPDRGPEPILLDLVTLEQKSITTVQGVWAMPAWR